MREIAYFCAGLFTYNAAEYNHDVAVIVIVAVCAVFTIRRRIRGK